MNGHPVLAYTINCALQSELFDKIYASTDSINNIDIAEKYGAKAEFLRPIEQAQDQSIDF